MISISRASKDLYLLLIFALFIVSALSQKCYYPSGNEASPGYQPCSKDTSDPLSTICCNVELGDVCLPNGLCAVSGWPPRFWRKFCTERDWTTGKCIDACISDDDFVQMTPCDGTGMSEVWCCGGTTNCCNNTALKPVTLKPHFGLAAATTNPTTSPTSESKPKSNSTTNNKTNEGNNDGGLSVGQKAGIGIGVPIGIIAIVLITFFATKWYCDNVRVGPTTGNNYPPPMYEGTEFAR